MRIPDQLKVMEKLEDETNRAHREFEGNAVAKLNKLWDVTKKALKDVIRHEYRMAFPKGEWTLAQAKMAGAMIRIDRATRQILQHFSSVAVPYIAAVIYEHRRNVKMRQAWMLDQVTPPGVHPKIEGRRTVHREARAISSGAVNLYLGTEAKTAWMERWDAWIAAYGSNLNNNIALGALNQSTPEDASQEVDVTRPGSPSNDFWDVMERLLKTTLYQMQVEAMDEFADENGDLIMTEVWTTRGEASRTGVCEDCQEFEGMTREEVGGEDEPGYVHPNCKCYYSLVPTQWSDFMKKIDPEMAKQLKGAGIAPTGMALRDENGKLSGITTVDFFDWKGNLVGTR